MRSPTKAELEAVIRMLKQSGEMQSKELGLRQVEIDEQAAKLAKTQELLDAATALIECQRQELTEVYALIWRGLDASLKEDAR